MDEKKNLTPNAIEDDKLDEVAGGGFGVPSRKVDAETLQQMLNGANKYHKKFTGNPIDSKDGN